MEEFQFEFVPLVKSKQWNDAMETLKRNNKNIFGDICKFNKESSMGVLSSIIQNDGPIPLIEKLISLSPSTLHERDEHGDTPLHHVARKGSNMKLMQLILYAAPGYMYLENKYRNTPLHLMISNHHLDGAAMIVRLMISQKITALEILNRREKFPTEIVDNILDFVPNIGLFQNHVGQTPMHLLAYGSGPLHLLAYNTSSHFFVDKVQLINLLINFSSDSLNITNRDGDTPFIIAKEVGAPPNLLQLFSSTPCSNKSSQIDLY